MESIPEKRDRSKAERKYFITKIAENHPSVALTPLKIKGSLVENVYRVEYRRESETGRIVNPVNNWSILGTAATNQFQSIF